MKKKNFTLLEILVVLGIIAILLSLLSPITDFLHKEQITKAKLEMKRIQIAINDYYNTYKRLPIAANSNEIIPLNSRQKGRLFKILSNKTNQAEKNKRKIDFYKKTLASGEVPFLDPWKEPYIIFMDNNFDQKVNLPTTITSNGKTITIIIDNPHRTIKSRVAIISIGFDNTSNINSWKNN